MWSQANLLGQTMATRLHAEGKTGVLWGETYSGYWQGANSTTPWWHNIIGMLSEVASARPTGAVVQDAARAAPGSLAVPPDRAPESPQLAPPSDVQFRMNYPEPWLGGRWTPRDVVEHHLLAALGLLEGVANNRVMLKRNFHAMQRRTVERFTSGGPWAFAVPAAQHDRGAADHLLRVLAAGGAEVEVVTGSGTAACRRAMPSSAWHNRWDDGSRICSSHRSIRSFERRSIVRTTSPRGRSGCRWALRSRNSTSARQSR